MFPVLADNFRLIKLCAAFQSSVFAMFTNPASFFPHRKIITAGKVSEGVENTQKGVPLKS
jgi:hypothetical protein